jgi:hypothetical protein
MRSGATETESEMTTRKVLILSGVAAVLAAGGIGAALADRPHGGPMGGPFGGPGMGPGMMGARFCEAKEPFAPRIMQRMERTLQPTDAQKADFEALKAAASKAEDQLKAGCPTDAERADATPPGRLNLAEKRMSAGLDALRTIKGPFDALYAKLDDKQRDRMRWAQRGWGGMGRWHHDGGDDNR